MTEINNNSAPYRILSRRYEKSSKKKTRFDGTKNPIPVHEVRGHGFRILVHSRSLRESVLNVVSGGGSESPPRRANLNEKSIYYYFVFDDIILLV